MEDEETTKKITNEDILKKRMDIILRYKEGQRIKKNVVSKNFKYFIKK